MATTPDTHGSPLTPDVNDQCRGSNKKPTKLTKKKSGSLRSRSKAMILGSVGFENAEDGQLRPVGVRERPLLHVPEGPMVADVPADNEAVASAVYFTIDPEWDGNEAADVYLLGGDFRSRGGDECSFLLFD